MRKVISKSSWVGIQNHFLGISLVENHTWNMASSDALNMKLHQTKKIHQNHNEHEITSNEKYIRTTSNEHEITSNESIK
jgi:hypothetical protein